MKGLRFIIDSELGNVAFVAVSVSRICVLLGFSEESASDVELCVTEAATNVILHSYGGHPGHAVEVQLSVRGEQLLLEVLDSGTSIPPNEVDRLVNGKAKRQDAPGAFPLPEGGRGLQIIHDLMDAISYTGAAGANRLTLIKEGVKAADR